MRFLKSALIFFVFFLKPLTAGAVDECYSRSFGQINNLITITFGNGLVYAEDTGNSQIQEFNPVNGSLSGYINLGQYNGGQGIAAANGELYVANYDARDILAFGNTNFSFGSGYIQNPFGVWADNSSQVYVADGSAIIKVFDGNGTYLRSISSPAVVKGNVILSGVTGITGDSTGAYIYVIMGENYYVQKFTSSGTFLTQWQEPNGGIFEGISADANGNVYVSTGEGCEVFDSNGNFESQFGVSGMTAYGLSVDNSGNVYVADKSSGQIVSFSPCVYTPTFTPTYTATSTPTGTPTLTPTPTPSWLNVGSSLAGGTNIQNLNIREPLKIAV